MSPPAAVDVLVVGAGLTGAATAWALARRGADVAVVEQHTPANIHGSSHGSARIVRRAYPDPLYVRWTGPAWDGWRELERQSGESLLRTTGAIDHGGRRDVRGIAATLADAGVAHELLPAREAAPRWPGMRFETDVLFHPQAGVLDAEAAVHAFLRISGVPMHDHCPVTAIRVLPDRAVVEAGGHRIRARRVVLAAGPWLGPLLDHVDGFAGRVPGLAVTQQQVFHFRRADEAMPAWPATIHNETLNTFHLPGGRDGGPGGARKVAEHDGGSVTTAAGRDGVVDPRARERVVGYVRDWLPGLVPEPFTEATCLYTTTPTEDFLLDRVGPIVVGSPCSGHGAKFSPAVGQLLASLALDPAARAPERFALKHATVAR